MKISKRESVYKNKKAEGWRWVGGGLEEVWTLIRITVEGMRSLGSWQLGAMPYPDHVPLLKDPP